LLLPSLDVSIETSAARPTDTRRTAVEWLVVVAASAGGIQAINTILARLATALPASVVLVQHRLPDFRDYLSDILSRGTAWPVQVAGDGSTIEAGHVYLARPDAHLTVTAKHTFQYQDGTRIRFTRSSANPLFQSAARAFGSRVIAVVLTGYGRDGTDGVQEVRTRGGVVIAQDAATSQVWDMPSAAIASAAVDYVLPLEAIAPAIERIVRGEPVEADIATAS
jgi:two-component system chemotaxis response regulator CheB